MRNPITAIRNAIGRRRQARTQAAMPKMPLALPPGRGVHYVRGQSFGGAVG